MIDSDLKQFGLLLTGVGEVYGKRLNETVIKIYWRAWEQYEFCDIKQALCDYVVNPDNGQYFPKPADIVKLLHGDSQALALQAWTKVCSAIRSTGAYSSVAFDDSLIHRVIEDMGGWQKLCAAQELQIPFIGHEFEKRYKNYVYQPPENYPKYLAGIIESQNAFIGYKDKNASLALIGNPIKAMDVVDGGVESVWLINKVGLVTKNADELNTSKKSKN